MTSMDNTPDSPAKTPDGCTPRGGNYWTLFTPEIWKVFHAVSHLKQQRWGQNVRLEQERIDWAAAWGALQRTFA
jgi:hypothetical protein